MGFFIFCAGLFFFGLQAKARVFNIDKQTFGGYFLASTGPSGIGTTALTKESSATDYGKGVEYARGAEFGFLWRQDRTALRFAFEVLSPEELTDITAKNSGGAQVYKVNSTITGYVPKIGLELHLLEFGSQRIYLQGAVGLATVYIRNVYSSLTIAPNTNHTVEMKGTGNDLQGGIGWEVNAFDQSTFNIEISYRNLSIDNFSYTKDVTTFSGSVQSDKDAFDTAGNRRALDMSAIFYSAGFRFWL